MLPTLRYTMQLPIATSQNQGPTTQNPDVNGGVVCSSSQLLISTHRASGGFSFKMWHRETDLLSVGGIFFGIWVLLI